MFLANHSIPSVLFLISLLVIFQQICISYACKKAQNLHSLYYYPFPVVTDDLGAGRAVGSGPALGASSVTDHSASIARRPNALPPFEFPSSAAGSITYHSLYPSNLAS